MGKLFTKHLSTATWYFFFYFKLTGWNFPTSVVIDSIQQYPLLGNFYIFSAYLCTFLTPSLGSCSPNKIFSKVVFPEPFSPRTAILASILAVRSTFSKIFRSFVYPNVTFKTRNITVGWYNKYSYSEPRHLKVEVAH